MVVEVANQNIETDERCPGCGETNPAHCHCGDIDDDDDDYFHGPCAHVFQGVDDHDECMHCGALRYYSMTDPFLHLMVHQ